MVVSMVRTPCQPVCRNASSIASGMWNFTILRLKVSSVRSATNSRARQVREA